MVAVAVADAVAEPDGDAEGDTDIVGAAEGLGGGATMLSSSDVVRLLE